MLKAAKAAKEAAARRAASAGASSGAGSASIAAVPVAPLLGERVTLTNRLREGPSYVKKLVNLEGIQPKILDWSKEVQSAIVPCR